MKNISLIFQNLNLKMLLKTRDTKRIYDWSGNFLRHYVENKTLDDGNQHCFECFDEVVCAILSIFRVLF